MKSGHHGLPGYCGATRRRPLTSRLTKKTRDEGFRGKHHGFSPMRGNWKVSTAVASGSGHETKRPTCRLRRVAKRSTVCRDRLCGETEVLWIELEIRRVLLPPAEQIGSPVFDPRAMDCPEGDAELVGDSPQPVSHFGEES